MVSRSVVVVALLLSLLSGIAVAEDTGELVILAKDADGKALASVQVLAWTSGGMLTGTTGADGVSTIKAAAGTYNVAVRAHSRVGTEQYDIVVKAGEKTSLEFELDKGVMFVGRVVDSANQPVVGADVVVEAGGTHEGYMEHTFGVKPWARDRTNSDGEFWVGGIPDGKVATVVVTAEGLQTARMGVRAIDGEIDPDPVVVRMGEGAYVSGVVTLPDGKPAADATVYVIPTDRPQLIESPTIWISGGDGVQEGALRGTTDEEGRYRVQGAQVDREYLVKAVLAGYAMSAAAKPVTPTADEPAASSDVTLSRGGALTLRLLAPDGTCIKVADVKVGSAMMAPELEAANKGEDFVFSGLNEGRTALEIEAPGFLKHIEAVELTNGETVEVRVTLDPGVRIVGKVQSATGEPVGGVRVSAPFKAPNPVTGWTSYENVEVKTDDDGVFDLGPLPKGEYELKLYSQEWSLQGEPIAKAPSEGVLLTAHRLGKATVRFLDPDGEPFEGSVFVWRAMASDPGTSSGGERDTDGGRLTLKAIGAAPSRFRFVFDDYATIVRDVSSPDGKDIDLGDITLDPGVTLRGRVVLPSGEPAADATIRMGTDYFGTEADGTFELENIPLGSIVISVKAEGLPRAFFPLEVTTSPEDHVLQLVAGVKIKTLLLDAEGQPVANDRVGVDVKVNGEWHSWGAGRSGEDGRFEGMLPIGEIRYTWAPGIDKPFVTLLETEIVKDTPREITLRIPKK